MAPRWCWPPPRSGSTPGAGRGSSRPAGGPARRQRSWRRGRSCRPRRSPPRPAAAADLAGLPRPGCRPEAGVGVGLIEQPRTDRGVQRRSVDTGQDPPQGELGRPTGRRRPSRPRRRAGQHPRRGIRHPPAIAVNEPIPATTAPAHNATTATTDDPPTPASDDQEWPRTAPANRRQPPQHPHHPPDAARHRDPPTTTTPAPNTPPARHRRWHTAHATKLQDRDL